MTRGERVKNDASATGVVCLRLIRLATIAILVTTGSIVISTGGVASADPASTGLATTLAVGSTEATSLTVDAGTAMTDESNLAGTNASTATGTVTYSVFSDAACSVSAGSGGTVTVSNGKVPDSKAVTEKSVGTYYWQASYSGDANNGASTSSCGPGQEVETTTIPAPYQSPNPSMVAFGGSTIAMHWSPPWWQKIPPNGLYFLVTSVGMNGSNAVPNFSSTSVVTFSGSATWKSSINAWSTSSKALSLAVPATPDLAYAIQIYTCSSVSNLCSNSPGAGNPTDGVETVNVANGNWTTAPYTQDFAPASIYSEGTSSNPLATTFSPDNTLWNTSEFSNGISDVAPGATSYQSFTNPYNTKAKPFAYCFSACTASSASALSEQVVSADGFIWYTDGGWEFPPTSSPANHSEVVAFNGSSSNPVFCTYVVPGDDNEVIGLAVTGSGSGTEVWFTESTGDRNSSPRNPTLDMFTPTSVGDGCPSTLTKSESYNLQPSDVTQVVIPGSLPGMVTADPTTSLIWVADIAGSEIDSVDTSSFAVTRYQWAPTNTYDVFGATPWAMVADANYLYAANYGDNSIVRINKLTQAINELPIPATTDTEQAYGLVLSGSRLYFTLSDDARPTFGDMTTFGYIDTGSWSSTSSTPSIGVVYSGLYEAMNPPKSVPDFRGLAVAPNGNLGIASLYQVAVLNPL